MSDDFMAQCWHTERPQPRPRGDRNIQNRSAKRKTPDFLEEQQMGFDPSPFLSLAGSDTPGVLKLGFFSSFSCTGAGRREKTEKQMDWKMLKKGMCYLKIQVAAVGRNQRN